MSTETVKVQRTPEEKAARAARKATKVASASAVTSTELEAPTHAESSSQALNKATPPVEPENARKRRRGSDTVKEIDHEAKIRAQENDPNLLEIDVDAPEPLSKAEIRAAKRRAKKGLPDPTPTTEPVKGEEEGDEAERRPAKRAKERDAEPKRQNSIWIGNLSFKCTEDSLRAFFEKGIEESGGDKEGCVTRIKLPKKEGHGTFAQNKGFAYIDFKSEELQQLAVGLSEKMLNGRRVLIKLGNDHAPKPDARTPKPERPKNEGEWILKKQVHPASSTLFVGNLPFDATEEGLRDLIEGNAADRAGLTKKAEEKKEEDEDRDDVKDGDMKVEEGEESKEVKEPFISARGGRKAGLRKVRLGAFEDTGRCKGFAFLDFLSSQDATASLVNRKNHTYEGRQILLQFASEDATKRSGGKAKSDSRDKGIKSSRSRAPKAKFAKDNDLKVEGQAQSGGAEGTNAFVDMDEPMGKKKDMRGKKWEAAGRPRPGAALAMAKREKVGIVAGEGKKITFD